MSLEDLEKRTVYGPDNEEINVDPLQDYYCAATPEAKTEAQKGTAPVIEKFANWARSESLWVLAYGTGCGAIEMRPLMTPKYDAYRFGVQWRPTPRQSNLFIISGYLSIKTLKIAIRAYEQMPSPKYVMGVGSCTINGGMYFDSYNTINRLDHYMPVDVYVAGCMPRPESLLAGFDLLKKLIKEGKGTGADKYATEFEWYKGNQKKIIKNWDMPDFNW